MVDADGSISQVQTIAMTIAEANPILGPINATTLSGSGKEPTTVAFDLSAISGAETEGADPLHGFMWDFDGDGQFDYSSASPFALHTYRDNKAGGGAYTATVRAFDEDGYSEEQITVDIQNVAPSLSLPASVSVLEGNLMALRAAASDPGDDALTFSISGAPAGLSLTQDGLLLWTPAFAQTSIAGKPYTVTVTVTDDDGESATSTVTLSAKSRDSDNDGMADTWEVANGLNPSVNDAAGRRGRRRREQPVRVPQRERRAAPALGHGGQLSAQRHAGERGAARPHHEERDRHGRRVQRGVPVPGLRGRGAHHPGARREGGPGRLRHHLGDNHRRHRERRRWRT